MAHGIIGKNAKRAVTRKLMERLWLQEEGGGGGRFIQSKSDE